MGTHSFQIESGGTNGVYHGREKKITAKCASHYRQAGKGEKSRILDGRTVTIVEKSRKKRVCQPCTMTPRSPAFTITPGIAEKLKAINPATIGRRLKKDTDPLRLKGKNLTTPRYSLKSHIPIRTFYTGEERKRWPVVCLSLVRGFCPFLA
jgi:hypothetical protein